MSLHKSKGLSSFLHLRRDVGLDDLLHHRAEKLACVLQFLYGGEREFAQLGDLRLLLAGNSSSMSFGTSSFMGLNLAQEVLDLLELLNERLVCAVASGCPPTSSRAHHRGCLPVFSQ